MSERAEVRRMQQSEMTETVESITDMIKRCLAWAEASVAGRLSASESAAAARHYTNVAKLLDLRCRFGDVKID